MSHAYSGRKRKTTKLKKRHFRISVSLRLYLIMLLPSTLDSKIIVFIFVFLLTACEKSENINQPSPDPDTEQEEEPQPELSNIKWENWYLSVPLNSGDGKATSIFYEDIVNENLSEAASEYFYKNLDGSYTMWTQFTGFTTSGLSDLGDKYCRTELREYWRGNQDVTDNWSMSSGTHTLETTMRVDYAEGNGRTIIAQIHAKESPGISGNPATVKIRWENGIIQIDYYIKPENGEPWSSQFDDKMNFTRVDSEIFTFRIKVENGKLYCGITCEEKNVDIDYTEIYDYVGNGYIHENYFKTGNYYIWNEDYEKAAQVKLYKVLTEHK